MLKFLTEISGLEETLFKIKHLINYNLLTEEEIFWLNNYHNKVYEKISNNLDREERNWLKKACSPYLKS